MQHLSSNPPVPSFPLHHFSHNPSVATFCWQPFSPNPLFTSGWKSLVANLQSQAFSPNSLVLTFQFQAAFNSLNI